MRSILIGLVLAAGTQVQADNLVGKWDCTGREDNSDHLRSVQTYQANGRFSHLANIAIGLPEGRVDASLALRGRWSLEGGQLVEEITKVRVRSISENGQEISRTPKGRTFTEFISDSIEQGEDSKMKITFLSPQQIQLIDDGVTGVCTKR